MTATANVTAALVPVTDWILDLGHSATKTASILDVIASAAADAAEELAHSDNVAGAPVASVVWFSPGDMTRYTIGLTRLPDDTARVLGGDLIVALPDFHQSLLVSTGGTFHIPGYVAEKINLAPGSVVVVAAFLTLLDAYLTDLT